MKLLSKSARGVFELGERASEDEHQRIQRHLNIYNLTSIGHWPGGAAFHEELSSQLKFPALLRHERIAVEVHTPRDVQVLCDTLEQCWTEARDRLNEEVEKSAGAEISKLRARVGELRDTLRKVAALCPDDNEEEQ